MNTDRITIESAWQAIQPIRGWFSNSKQARIIWSELTRNGGHAIEIGTFCGRSAIFMAYALKAMQSTSKVWCIDTFSASNVELPDEDTFEEFSRNVEQHGVGDWIEVIRGDSRDQAVVDRVPKDASIVYIDAGHEYEEVLGDIRRWRKHVAKSGILMLHDYYTDGSEQFPGIRQAVKEARAKGLLNNRIIIPSDSVYFRRSQCGCGGW